MHKRIRASTPRSRSGCANCRQRRIKCDEALPACQRCIRSGWPCPGYPSAIGSRNSSPGALASADHSKTGSVSDIPTITVYNVPFKTSGNQGERKALHYFANFAAVDFAAYPSSDFWSHTVLQRCQHEASIRHATAALGRLYVEYMSAPDTSQFSASPETTQAYNKSLKALRTYIGKPDKSNHATILMCSALFYCYELIQDDRLAALRHLQNGLHILNWQKSNVCGNDAIPADEMNHLLDVFARMDLQASGFDGQRSMQLTLDYDADQVLNTMLWASPFASLCDAQNDLFPILHSSLSFLVDNAKFRFYEPANVPAAVFARRQSLLERLRLWDHRIKLLEQTRQISSNERSALLGADLHALMMRLLLWHCINDSQQAIAPTFDDMAERILSDAREVLEMEASTNDRTSSSGSITARFSLQLGIVAPLSILALKTLRTEVREAVVELLRKTSGRREGFFDAQTTVNIIGGLAALKDDRDDDAQRPKISHSHLTQSSRPPALEWSLEDIAKVDDESSETERWKGFDRVLALKG